MNWFWQPSTNTTTAQLIASNCQVSIGFESIYSTVVNNATNECNLIINASAVTAGQYQCSDLFPSLWAQVTVIGETMLLNYTHVNK